MSPAPPTGFERYRRRAERLAGSPEAVKALLGRAAGKMTSAGGARLDAVRSDLALLIDLLRCWVRGEYEGASIASIVSIIAAILYFVVPFDLIPDFLLGFGFIDDVAVIGYVMGVVRGEIEAFRAWRDKEDEPCGGQ